MPVLARSEDLKVQMVCQLYMCATVDVQCKHFLRIHEHRTVHRYVGLETKAFGFLSPL